MPFVDKGGVEGNQKNGGREGTSSMDRCGRGPGPGLAQSPVPVMEGCSRGGKAMLKGREGGFARGLGRRDGAQHPRGALVQVGVDFIQGDWQEEGLLGTAGVTCRCVCWGEGEFLLFTSLFSGKVAISREQVV